MTDTANQHGSPTTDGHTPAPRSLDATVTAMGNPPTVGHVVPFIEMMFFAYRDFVSDPDALLNDIGFGRAHHRVLHFVNREPGLRVADLLDILKITKQSLGRALKPLIDDGYIIQHAGESDRRERRLYPTDKGKALFESLLHLQLARVGNALRDVGPSDLAAIERFLFGMITPEERAFIRGVMERARTEGAQPTPSEAGGHLDHVEPN